MIKSTWASQKQPFVDNDPAKNQLPTSKTSTPSLLKTMIQSIIAEACSSKPFGLYDGPILAPSLEAKMKAAVITTKIPAGLTASVELTAVEHNLKTETKLLGVDTAY